MRRSLLRRWPAAALIAAVAVAATSFPAHASPTAPTTSVPGVTSNVSGMSLTLADGTTRTPTVRSRSGAPLSTTDVGVAANTCYLGGGLPSLLPTENQFTEEVYFNASLRCDADVVGTPQLWVAIQQRFLDSYITEKIEGPLRGNPVILGVRAEKDCVQISLGPWRGVAHPMVVTDAVIYDWGWIPTYDQSLAC